MTRYRFFSVFKENPDGTLTPLRAINVNGVIVGPGVSFGSGVALGGVNFQEYKNLDIAGEDQGSVLVIKGFYQSGV
ncbi:MAG: hypothetical protein WCJ29_01370 [bacterium]